VTGAGFGTATCGERRRPTTCETDAPGETGKRLFR